MSSYHSLDIIQFPKTSTKTSETKFWKQFKNPIVIENPAKVTDIRFSAIRPYDVAISASSRVQILQGGSGELKKTISRFKTIAYSADYRYDGRVVAAGTEEGVVQIFDLSSRSILRSLKGHSAASKCVRFASGSPNILFSGSDDKTAARWDMSTQKLLDKLVGHTDYVRAITDQYLNESAFSFSSSSSSSSSSSNDSTSDHSSSSPLDGGHRLVITGSYDHSIRLWDTRSSTKSSQITIDHGYPVESLLVARSGSLLYASGDCFLKVYNLLKGGECVASISNHTKTITSLSLDGSGTRLMSASLDQFVKFYDLSDYTVTHSIKYDGPILTAAVSPDNTLLAVGMADGKVNIRRREVTIDDNNSDLSYTSASIRTGTAKWFQRGANHKPSEDDYAVEVGKKRKLTAYDSALKKFHYHEALDAAIASQSSAIVYSVLSELIDRGGLRIALSGRDESTLIPLLRFLVKYLIDPRYSSLLIDVTHMIIDIYSAVLGQSPLVDDLFLSLKTKLEEEQSLHSSLYNIQGALDTLLSCAAIAEDRAIIADEDADHQSTLLSISPQISALNGIISNNYSLNGTNNNTDNNNSNNNDWELDEENDSIDTNETINNNTLSSKKSPKLNGISKKNDNNHTNDQMDIESTSSKKSKKEEKKQKKISNNKIVVQEEQEEIQEKKKKKSKTKE